MAAKLHRWLALAAAIPILMWFISGLFISLVPMDAIHGDHGARRHEPAAFAPALLSDQLGRALKTLDKPVTRVDVREMLGRPVALVETGSRRPLLLDLATGRRLSPLDERTAVALARRDFAAGQPVRAELLQTEQGTYRGPVPVWRIDFDDADRTSVYVAADLGRAVARRNDLFALYDAMWSMHILNWRDPEAINSWWLWSTAALALIVAVTGIALLPSRLRLRRARRTA